MPTVFETMLRPFTAKKPAATAAQQRAAAQEVVAKLQAARDELAAAKEAHGPLLLKALGAGDNVEAAKLRDSLAAKETAVRDLEALQATTQAAVRDLDHREADAAIRQRWADACVLVGKRTEAGAHVQTALDQVAAGLLEMAALENEIMAVLPSASSSRPVGWGHDLERLVLRYMAGAAAPMFRRHCGLNTVHELRVGPSFVDQVRASGELTLANAPSSPSPAAKAATRGD